MELSLQQKFETERMKRVIDNTESVDDLRQIAKLFLEAWERQKAATRWAMEQGLPEPSEQMKAARNKKV